MAWRRIIAQDSDRSADHCPSLGAKLRRRRDQMKTLAARLLAASISPRCDAKLNPFHGCFSCLAPHLYAGLFVGRIGRSLMRAPIPPRSPHITVSRAYRACGTVREGIAPAKPAVARTRSLALLERIKAAIRPAVLATVVCAPRAVSVRAGTGQENSGKRDCSDRNCAHEYLFGYRSPPDRSLSSIRCRKTRGKAVY
jgi:hypothetical protein